MKTQDTRGDPDGNNGLRVVMLSQCRLIAFNPRAAWWGTNVGRLGRGEMGKSLYLLHSMALTLKLVPKLQPVFTKALTV